MTCDEKDNCTIKFKDPAGRDGDDKCAAGLEYEITDHMFDMINASGNGQRQWTGVCSNNRSKKVEVLKVMISTSNSC